MAAQHYDPTAWLSEWSDRDQPVLEAWREVHVRFGLAAQKSTEIESGLAMLIAQLRQELSKRPEFGVLLAGLKDCAIPLGSLISLFCRLYQIRDEDDIARELWSAKKAQNYLIHHFYRDRADLFTTPGGCKKLVEILVGIYDDLDAALTQLEAWRDAHLGYAPPEDLWGRISDDVARWKSENHQMLDALLGNSERTG